MSDMSYRLALERLAKLGQELHTAPGLPRRKFELAHMRRLMTALGDPQTRCRSVLIAGTNGKGSASSTLASILTAAGYTAGLYTSPHLSRVNERIQIGGAPIPDDEFAKLFFRVERVAAELTGEGELPAPPSFFETMTAIAFQYFGERRVDIAVLEVGMGGRLDATNIVDPMLSIITDISLDHMEWLGSTIAEIAGEKAGILRPNGTMVTLSQHPEANQALGEAAAALGVRGINASDYLPARQEPLPVMRNRYPLTVLGETIEVDSPLGGAHQQRNLSLAIAAAVELRNCYGYELSAGDIEKGIRNTFWPGRLELLTPRDRAKVLFDVGHNPAGAWALRAAISRMERAGQEPATLVFGCLNDKPLAELAQILFPLFRQAVLTPVHSPRSALPDDLAAAARATGTPFRFAENAAAALEDAFRTTPQNDLIVVTGSVYLVGELRERVAGSPFVNREMLSR